MSKPTRLFDFLDFQVKNKPLDVSIASKVNDQWKTYSSKQFSDQAYLVSNGLLELGIEKGDKIAMVSHNNRTEWNIMDMGILQLGAVNVPVYPNMSSSDYEYIMNHAEVKYCIVSNQELCDKVAAVKDKIPSLKEIYSFEDLSGCKNWNEILELGKNGTHEKVDAYKQNVDTDDLATLIYTSGTTGTPKGVMLCHRNIVSNSVDSSPRIPDLVVPNPKALSFLPVCHIFERMLQYLYMYESIGIYFAQSIETIKEDLQEVQPNVFAGVPRLLEKFFDGIVSKGYEAGGIKTAIFKWAVGVALDWKPNESYGWFYKKKLNLARKLVFSKVKAALGLTDIHAVVSGGAALQARLARFFNGAGIPVLEGYGLTETSPVICVNSTNGDLLKIGHVGKPIINVEIKIASDGEVLCKGPNVMMGYYKNPELTSEILVDGWFHTGDIGEINNGFLKITDRKKEMFKTSGGKYIAPQVIENLMKESLLIEQSMVVGEGKKFPAAFIIPSEDGLKGWCARKNIPFSDFQSMCKDERIINKIEKELAKINSKLGSWEQIKMFKIIDHLFTVEGGEMTPKLSLKRKVILQKYEGLIKEIYNED